MKLTRLHLEFWRQRRCPTPSWAHAVAAKEKLVDVDDIINLNVRLPDPHFSAHNLLHILTLIRKRKGDLREALTRMARDPGCLIRPKERARYCRKWLRRLNRSPHAQNRIESHRELLP